MPREFITPTPDHIVAYLQTVLHQIAQLPAEDQEQWLGYLDSALYAVEQSLHERPPAA